MCNVPCRNNLNVHKVHAHVCLECGLKNVSLGHQKFEFSRHFGDDFFIRKLPNGDLELFLISNPVEDKVLVFFFAWRIPVTNVTVCKTVTVVTSSFVAKVTPAFAHCPYRTFSSYE